jgi:hypothetical protein
MKSFKQYLESADPDRYNKIVSNESLNTKEWKRMNEDSTTGWHSLEANPEATERYINWVVGERY